MNMAIARKVFLGILLICTPLLAAALAQAETWPPADPNEGNAAVEITTQWAKELREAHVLSDVQRSLDASGKLERIESKGSTSRAVFSWTGRNGKGRMRLFAYRSGGFAAIVAPADSPDEIVLNSFGAFMCRDCAPPVSACGRRPSWIPHDLHWDNFDCPHTVTGPQDMPGGLN